jgi:hypothetical protein
LMNDETIRRRRKRGWQWRQLTPVFLQKS